METTAVRKRTISPTRKATREKVFIDIPQADMLFLQLFADKMGWLVNNKQNLWDKYVQSSPQNVDLSDEDIMKEVRTVRYGEM